MGRAAKLRRLRKQNKTSELSISNASNVSKDEVVSSCSDNLEDWLLNEWQVLSDFRSSDLQIQQDLASQVSNELLQEVKKTDDSDFTVQRKLKEESFISAGINADRRTVWAGVSKMNPFFVYITQDNKEFKLS